MNKRDQRTVQTRLFKCSECGVKTVMTKAKRHTNIGHIKHAYCHICKRETAHEQIE